MQNLEKQPSFAEGLAESDAHAPELNLINVQITANRHIKLYSHVRTTRLAYKQIHTVPV